MSMIGNYLRVTPEQLEALKKDPESITDFLDAAQESAPDGYCLDIDSAWQGIHYLLTGDPLEGEFPLANAVLGGYALGEVDVGYGPARYLEPEDVAACAEALSQLSEADVRSRFDPAAMMRAKIYPMIWDEGEDALIYLLEYYGELVPFFQKASAAGDAILEYLN